MLSVILEQRDRMGFTTGLREDVSLPEGGVLGPQSGQGNQEMSLVTSPPAKLSDQCPCPRFPLPKGDLLSLLVGLREGPYS